MSANSNVITNIEHSDHTSPQKRNLPAPILAFFLGSLLFTLLLTVNGFLSINGSSMCLGDSFDQYIAFIESFMRVLKGEQDFWYSFSLYAGSGSVLTYTYYCLSPFNLLYLLPGISIIVTTHIISIIKAGLAAASFSWYSNKTLRLNKASSIFFSLCYTFCSWAVIMSINYMWADSLYVLPLLIIFLYEFIKRTSPRNYLALTLCYAYLFITNFYMGYIIGIFTALYFICTVISVEVEAETDTDHTIPIRKHLFTILKKVVTYVLSVVLAAAIDAALLLPSCYFLIKHLRGVTSTFVQLPATLPDIFSAFFLGSGSGIYSVVPYIYCGLPVLLLFPFYFFVKEIHISKKISAALMLIFYLCGSMILPLYAFLHAFDNPDHYPFRFSPCIVFILVSLACRVWQYKNELIVKNLCHMAIGLCVTYAFIVLFNGITGYSSVSNTLLVINATFLFSWLLTFILLNKGSITILHHLPIGKFFPYVAFFLLASELLISSSLSFRSIAGIGPDDYNRITANEFDSWFQSETDAVQALKASDSDFYRVRINGEKCFNGAALFGFNTLTSFASYEELRQRNALSGLGIGNAYHMLYDINDVSFTDMIFAVKYIININNEDNQQDYGININDRALPIAYTVSSDIASYEPSDDPFENINKLASCMTGHKIKVCERITPDMIKTDSFNANFYDLGDLAAFDIMADRVDKGWVTFAIPKNGNSKIYSYFRPTNGTYFNSPSPFITRGMPIGLVCTTSIASGSIYEVNKTADATEFNSDEPDFNIDDYVYTVLYINTEGFTSYAVEEILFAYYNDEAVTETYDYLKEGALQINTLRDSHIEGTVTATEERPVLFTSIPYDKGWTAYVDGTPTKIYVTLNDAFCTLALSPGEHTVVFDYDAPYSFSGKLVSCGAIFVAMIIFLKSSTGRLKKNTRESEPEDSK